jgi:hypothetical protein
MSVAPLSEPFRSAAFDDDLNVLRGFAEAYGFEPPVVRFGEDVWDSSAVPDRPAYLPAYSLVVRFDRITQPTWRLMVKELLCARLYPTHPAVVAAIPNRRRRPAPLGEAYVRVLLYRRWLDWLAEHGITSLGEVRQEHCDRYYSTRAKQIAPETLGPIRCSPARCSTSRPPAATSSPRARNTAACPRRSLETAATRHPPPRTSSGSRKRSMRTVARAARCRWCATSRPRCSTTATSPTRPRPAA